MAILLIPVQSIAHDKDVWNRETTIVNRDWNLAALGFVQQGADAYRPWCARVQVRMEKTNGMAAIDDVLDNEDVSPTDIFTEALYDLYLATTHRPTAIARQAHKGYLYGQIKDSYEVGQKDK
jgi:hypothetical protein